VQRPKANLRSAAKRRSTKRSLRRIESTVPLRSLQTDAEVDFPLIVEVDDGHKKLTANVRFGLDAEVVWSLDSRAFAITGSSEGANGIYWTDVFLIDREQLVRVPLTKRFDAPSDIL
jgi:hypothetical protein